jgi:Domain of unknown function (DUF4265)
VPFGDDRPEAQLRHVIEVFSALGAECEGALPAFKLVALDIPPTASFREIKTLLMEGRAAGRWENEEGCIDEAWIAL